MKSQPKSWVTAFLLCTFLGATGAHRFYLGKVGTGFAQLFTVGGLGIWSLFDWFMIVSRRMTDKEGQKLA